LNEVRIRTGSHDEVAAVLSLWRACGISPGLSDSSEGIATLLASAPAALLVAEDGQLLVGTLIAAWDGWRGSFYRLAVVPGRRREGIATALVREGERRLTRLGAGRLTAIVEDDDAGAIAFWQACGFSLQPRRARYIRHP
jgi:ribosomal protein S18 acetylase RimI-like enzyme